MEGNGKLMKSTFKLDLEVFLLSIFRTPQDTIIKIETQLFIRLSTKTKDQLSKSSKKF